MGKRSNNVYEKRLALMTSKGLVVRSLSYYPLMQGSYETVLDELTKERNRWYASDQFKDAVLEIVEI